MRGANYVGTGANSVSVVSMAIALSSSVGEGVVSIVTITMSSLTIIEEGLLVNGGGGANGRGGGANGRGGGGPPSSLMAELGLPIVGRVVEDRGSGTSIFS